MINIYDFNRDGMDDVAITTNNGMISILLLYGKEISNESPMIFSKPHRLEAGFGATNIAISDFNNDENVDYITVNKYSDSLSVYLEKGDKGNIYNAYSMPIHLDDIFSPNDISLEDFNSDGIIDFVLIHQGTVFFSTFMGREGRDGSSIAFEAQYKFEIQGSPTDIVSEDFNQDGIIDLAVSDCFRNQILIFLGKGTQGRGDGSFELLRRKPIHPELSKNVITDPIGYKVGKFPESLISSDFNGDGIIDLVTSDKMSNTVSVLIGTGNKSDSEGIFHEAIAYPTNETTDNSFVSKTSVNQINESDSTNTSNHNEEDDLLEKFRKTRETQGLYAAQEFKKAKDKHENAVCRSNLRKIEWVVLTYLLDNDLNNVSETQFAGKPLTDPVTQKVLFGGSNIRNLPKCPFGGKYHIVKENTIIDKRLSKSVYCDYCNNEAGK